VLGATGFSFDGQRLLFVQGARFAQRRGVFAGRQMDRLHQQRRARRQRDLRSAVPCRRSADPFVAASGRHPRWTRDGRQAIYRTNDDALVSVGITPAGSALQIGAPEMLFTERRTFRTNWYFSMDALGQRFVLAQPPPGDDSDQTVILNVILNFAAHVKMNPR
jgi:hypothetical protein